MKSLIDAIGRERASTLMEQAVADAIRDNLQLGLLQTRATHSRDVSVRSKALFAEACSYCLSAIYRLGAVPRNLNWIEYEF